MNKRLFAFMGFSLFAIPACSHSLREIRAESAGRVGCSAEETQVSAPHDVDGAETWTAWCGDQTYFVAAASAPSSIAESEPPKSVAGFEFKSDRAAAEKKCKDAGKSWRVLDEDDAVCSGTAASVGFDAQTQLAFCGGELCSITVFAEPRGSDASKWIAEYAGVRKTLEAEYGPSQASSAGEHADEGTGKEVRACLLDGRSKPAVMWRWQHGAALTLTMAKGARGVAIWIAYADRAVGPKGAPAL